jgi:hypothetical protein
MGMKRWWLQKRVVGVVVLCLLLGLLHPIGLAFSQVGDSGTWTNVLKIEVAAPQAPACPVQASPDDAFGRQLDILTSFYTTIITLCLALFAVVAAFAFYTISFVSRERAEEIALKVLESKEFKARVDQVVEERVDESIDPIRADMEDIQAAYEADNKTVSEAPALSNEGENNGDH